MDFPPPEFYLLSVWQTEKIKARCKIQVEEYTMIFLQLGFIFSAAGKLKRKSVLQNPGGGQT